MTEFSSSSHYSLFLLFSLFIIIQTHELPSQISNRFSFQVRLGFLGFDHLVRIDTSPLSAFFCITIELGQMLTCYNDIMILTHKLIVATFTTKPYRRY